MILTVVGAGGGGGAYDGLSVMKENVKTLKPKQNDVAHLNQLISVHSCSFKCPPFKTMSGSV